jgi:hypothetical protein
MKRITEEVAIFVHWGYPEAQEVKIDLLFLFMTSLNPHTFPEPCALSPEPFNEFFGKDAAGDLLFCSIIGLSVVFLEVFLLRNFLLNLITSIPSAGKQICA